ncbi:hypothetical protein N9J98_00650 [Flavobacteriaceae bacterium]|jgi:hypothetical protein|nr:hypothetical protein [Flavobacteriaceae bacterium]|tara:strand:- start:991 stop:1392 length:402 start_codon:yes stop_codon:yes gene_type:complete
MLRNVSYNNSIISNEIEILVGKQFTILERIKMKGIGSSNLLIQYSNDKINNLLNLDNNLNKCNIEIRPKGIIIRFKVLLETYALVMPYYKLKVFKGKSDQYSLYKDEYVMKLKVKNLNDHDFFKKISKFRISS